MKHYLVIGSALFGLAVVATAADARMMGGGSTGISHISGGTVHTGLSSSLSDTRHNTWKKPIDSDGGGASDPTPKTTGKGNGGGTTVTGDYYPVRRHPGYPHNPHHYDEGGNGIFAGSGNNRVAR